MTSPAAPGPAAPVPLALTVHRAVPASGRALVLLHGFPVDHRMWDDVAAALLAGAPDAAPGWGLLAPDLPGLGTSPLPDAAPSVDVSAAAVARALDDAGVSSAVVVGMSMGGYVALALLRRRPDLVSALGLVDTKHTADAPEARENRERVARAVEQSGSVDAVRDMSVSLLAPSARGPRTDLSARVAALIDAQAPDGIAWSQRAMAARGDSARVLRDFSGPVAVVVGDEDDVTPPSAAARMSELTADAVLTTVPGAGHLAAMEQPREVAAALAALVARAWPEPPARPSAAAGPARG